MSETGEDKSANQSIDAESVAGDATRGDAVAQEQGVNPKTRVAASDPRSLTNDWD